MKLLQPYFLYIFENSEDWLKFFQSVLCLIQKVATTVEKSVGVFGRKFECKTIVRSRNASLLLPLTRVKHLPCVSMHAFCTKKHTNAQFMDDENLTRCQTFVHFLNLGTLISEQLHVME